jgi:carnitine O-acetyltransferase
MICAIAEENQPTSLAVGALTAGDRDAWADHYAKLRATAYPHNASILERIQSSAFILCLDDTSPVTREELAHACWHGYGSNRWFDKAVQLIVFQNGKAGFLGEHSMMDATVPARLCDYICERYLLLSRVIHCRTLKTNPVRQMVQMELQPPIALRFRIPASPFAGIITQTLQQLERVIQSHDVQVLAYRAHGKDFIKSISLSPDSYIQMALQLAYYKLMGTCAATYETAGMRRYSWGRTETCRSVSSESVRFITAMHDQKVTV